MLIPSPLTCSIANTSSIDDIMALVSGYNWENPLLPPLGGADVGAAVRCCAGCGRIDRRRQMRRPA